MTTEKTNRGRPKDPAKTQQILDSAGCLFLRNGLKGTSMDAVAKEADVSKQTLYSHFAGKDDLYRAVLEWKLNKYEFSDTGISFSGALEEDLNTFGRQMMYLQTDTQAINMLKSVIAESQNYQKMSALFYKNAIEKVVSRLEHYLENHNINDARFYAVAFLNILEGEWHMKVMMGLEEPPTKEEIHSYVAKVCRCFMRMVPT